MPHQCTSCGRTFSDGSKEMLSGCPDCGGNKFQFKPPGATESNAGPGTDKPDTPTGRPDGPTNASDAHTGEPDASTNASDARTGGPDASTNAPNTAAPAETKGSTGSRDATTQSSADTTRENVDAPRNDSKKSPEDDAEDRAQASARSDVVSPDELPDRDDAGARPETVSSEGEKAPGDRPGLDSLREELNDQFESIRIVSQGEYELNLMELFDRQEYIISLREDGRYVIEMPGDWGPDDE